MNAPSPFPAADRFAWMIGALCKAVAARGGRCLDGKRLPGPLVVLIWTRINRIGQRVAAIIARYQAGTLRTRQPRNPAAPPPRAPSPRAPSPTPPEKPRWPPSSSWGKLPQTIAWLLPLVPEARFGNSWLRDTLDDPQMAALLAPARNCAICSARSAACSASPRRPAAWPRPNHRSGRRPPDAARPPPEARPRPRQG